MIILKRMVNFSLVILLFELLLSFDKFVEYYYKKHVLELFKIVLEAKNQVH